MTHASAAPYRLVYESPYGRLVLAGDDTFLTHLLLPNGGMGLTATPKPGAAVRRAARQLDEYFAGKRRTFDLSLSPRGTEFQVSVWNALAEIPYGETISYAELAQWVGRPGAFRAVGQANGANPLAIVLPCHRVIAAGGTLGGYGGGLDLKRSLLTLEGYASAATMAESGPARLSASATAKAGASRRSVSSRAAS
jgi:methylated-DNA-[protein]-cysteine S-methyltransferase